MKWTASFPMYDFPEVRDALDTIWRSIAWNLEQEGFNSVPPGLVHGRAVRSLWSDPTLLLSQCCGYDLVNRYAGKLVALATPQYTAPGCRGSDYCSVIVVAEDSSVAELEQLRDSVCVINGLESHSGANALRALIGPLSRKSRFFSRVRISGSHANSIVALTNREVDATCIDCVTYALLERYRPSFLTGTRRLCYTTLAPGIPYVTQNSIKESLVTQLQKALLEAFEQPRVQAACESVFIDGIEVLPAWAYERILEMEQLAAAQDYPELG